MACSDARSFAASRSAASRTETACVVACSRNAVASARILSASASASDSNMLATRSASVESRSSARTPAARPGAGANDGGEVLERGGSGARAGWFSGVAARPRWSCGTGPGPASWIRRPAIRRSPRPAAGARWSAGQAGSPRPAAGDSDGRRARRGSPRPAAGDSDGRRARRGSPRPAAGDSDGRRARRGSPRPAAGDSDGRRASPQAWPCATARTRPLSRRHPPALTAARPASGDDRTGHVCARECVRQPGGDGPCAAARPAWHRSPPARLL